jgi:hypothetical protein
VARLVEQKNIVVANLHRVNMTAPEHLGPTSTALAVLKWKVGKQFANC